MRRLSLVSIVLIGLHAVEVFGAAPPPLRVGKPSRFETKGWYVSCLAVSPDSRTLVYEEFDPVKKGLNLVFRALPSGELLRRTPLPFAELSTGVLFFPDGKRIALGVRSGVSVYDLRGRRVAGVSCSTKEIVEVLAISPDGRTLVAKGYGEPKGAKRFSVWEVGTGKRMSEYGWPPPPARPSQDALEAFFSKTVAARPSRAASPRMATP